jgi:pimeloyl-ACP methyl ester carboxylesterase
MLLAAARPDLIAGAVLNDIGPVIEAAGLRRIKSYVGRLPQPKDFDDASEILRALFGAQFPRLTADDWRGAAQRMWEEREGRLQPSYDPRLADALAEVDPENPVPTLWAQFDALRGIPLMVIRGANSDILSRETVAAMRQRRPDASFIEVPDEGHPALLADAGTIGRVADFIRACGMPAPGGLPNRKNR